MCVRRQLDGYFSRKHGRRECYAMPTKECGAGMLVCCIILQEFFAPLSLFVYAVLL